jgi:hypothetical protein
LDITEASLFLPWQWTIDTWRQPLAGPSLSHLLLKELPCGIVLRVPKPGAAFSCSAPVSFRFHRPQKPPNSFLSVRKGEIPGGSLALGPGVPPLPPPCGRNLFSFCPTRRCHGFRLWRPPHDSGTPARLAVAWPQQTFQVGFHVTSCTWKYLGGACSFSSHTPPGLVCMIDVRRF